VGVTIVLEEESGKHIETVEDVSNAVLHAIAENNGAAMPFARTIDPYGDTVFNRLQAPLLRRELEMLLPNTTSETARLLAQVLTLLQRCEHEVHLYVKWYGD